MQIITEQSILYGLISVLIAFLASYFLYKKDDNFSEISKWILNTMRVLRFVFVFILSFLLLSPMVRTFTKFIEKPIVILAQDNSESVLLNKDSSFYKNQYIADYEKLKTELSTKYDVKNITFGKDIYTNSKINFTDKLSDYSFLFEQIQTKFSNRNVGAMVLFGDGIFNKGVSPEHLTNEFNFPIYTVALGDTNKQKDIIIKKVTTNKLAFLGNKFPVKVLVEINELKGINSNLKIKKDGNIIFTKNINPNTNSFLQEIDIELDAKKIGLQTYHIFIKPIESEISKTNNYKDLVIDVVDNKQKILILANSPHPDIAALKKSLSLNDRYDIDIEYIDRFTKQIKDYSMIILHQLPSTKYNASTIIKKISKYKIPSLYILGTQTDLKIFNSLHKGTGIKSSKLVFDESQAIVNKNFDMFTVSQDLAFYIENMPPLITPFGDYKSVLNSDIFLFQNISKIQTSKPLVLFNKQSDNKIGFIFGEGMWRWRMNDYIQNENFEMFDIFINKIVQYLALKVKKDRFIIETKKIFQENENIIFGAELYNESYELINNIDINLDITNIEGKTFSYLFGKTFNAYNIGIGSLPKGDYSYKTKVEIDGKKHIKTGIFKVVSVNIEELNTIANHNLLYKISANTKGRLYYPRQLPDLLKEIQSNKEIVPLSYSEKSLQDIIYYKWIFFLLLSFISIEWFFRKYFGSY